MPDANDEKMPDAVREELERSAGLAPSVAEKAKEVKPFQPEKEAPPGPSPQQLIDAINTLGREVQATQAAVLRAQIRTQVSEDKLMELATEVKRLTSFCTSLADVAKNE